MRHEKGAQADGAERDNAVEGVNGEAEFVFVFNADDDGFAFFAEVGVLGGDVEGVEEFFHVRFSRR